MSQTPLAPPETSNASPPKPYSLGLLLCHLLLLLLFGLGLFLHGGAMLNHAYTPDLPWLLASGHWILDHHQIPSHDLFSWSFPDKPWVLYQWLFEVVTAFLHQLLGEQGLIRLFMSWVILLYLGLPLIRGMRQGIPTVFTMIVSLLALLALSINVSLRPMIATAFLLALQYLLIQQFRRQKLSFKALLPVLGFLYMIWGNMHTGVVLGLFSLALMALGDLLERTRLYSFTPTRSDLSGTPQGLKPYAILALTGFGASIINPYGFGIYTYLVNLSTQPFMNATIQELQSPNFHAMPFWFFSALMVMLILLMPLARRSLAALDLLHLLVFSLLTLFILRFVVWACVFYALIFPLALYQGWLSLRSACPKWDELIMQFERFRPMILLTVFGGLLVFLLFPHLFPPVQHGSCDELRPAIAKYQRLKMPGDRLWTDAETGSCTLAQYPAQKVFIDTRFDFYGDEFMKFERGSAMLLGDWQGFMKRWELNTLVMRNDWPIVRLLIEREDFDVLYRDKHAIILRKKPKAGVFRHQPQE